ncbi:exonuclease domain-containing protein [Kitasatospora sp. NPDC094011]|uniref:3'-5' exonuclease n=1 Tax=Kitasatospora sp. NPDC094011 TaxID=3364090 RepID=UPI00381F8DF0
MHGITNQTVADAPPWERIGEQVRADLEGAWIAARNAHVDYGVLLRHLPGWQPAGVLDTLRLARATYPKAPGYGLDALIELCGIDLSAVPGKRHRAAYDAHAAALLLLHLAGQYASWSALVAAAVPPRCPGTPSRRRTRPCGEQPGLNRKRALRPGLAENRREPPGTWMRNRTGSRINPHGRAAASRQLGC